MWSTTTGIEKQFVANLFHSLALNLSSHFFLDICSYSVFISICWLLPLFRNDTIEFRFLKTSNLNSGTKRGKQYRRREKRRSTLTRRHTSFFLKSTRCLKRKVFVVNLILKFNFHICMHYTITFCVISLLCVCPSIEFPVLFIYNICLSHYFILHLSNLSHTSTTEKKMEAIASKHQSMIFSFFRQRTRDRKKRKIHWL